LVLTALADPTRRRLLNDLDTSVGIPISYLRQEFPMSRQALHKHLEVLAGAGVVVKSGRGTVKLYYMDPRPIRLVFAMLARRYKRDLRPLGNLYKYGSPYRPWD
jgi:DNA-binding transcriptional ArsR family regulator